MRTLSALLDPFQPKKNARNYAEILIRDIARRDAVSPEAVLEKAGIAELLSRPGHPLENFDALTKRLEALRYPLWHEKKEKLHALSASFKAKSGGITLEYPDFAEGDSVTIRFTVGSLDELSRRIAALESEKETLGTMLTELNRNE